MAVTAQTGIFSFGGQSAKNTVAATFYRHRATDIDLSTISDDRLGPPEVGGQPVPTIPFRAGVIATGGAVLNPRLEDTIGWLLHGATGAWSTTADEDVNEVAVTGMENNEFTFASDEAFLPYLTFRKEVPGLAAGADDLGEQFQDCKIVNLAIALPNDGLISTRIDMVGRAAGTNFVFNPSWSYDNLMEDYLSIPIGSVTSGFMKIPGFSGTELPIVAANIALTNAPLDIRQEKVFGDPFIEEVTVVGRALTVDLVVKWKDPDLFASILTGATTGTQWVQAPFVQDLDILTESPNDIPGTSPLTPYQLRIRAPQVMYQVVGGIRLAGNQSVAIRVTGTALADPAGYMQFNLGNTQTDYAWPT